VRGALPSAPRTSGFDLQQSPVEVNYVRARLDKAERLLAKDDCRRAVGQLDLIKRTRITMLFGFGGHSGKLAQARASVADMVT